MTDTPTRPEIRQAVAWGRQAALREILDKLAKRRPIVGGWRTVYTDKTPTSMAWDETENQDRAPGYDEVVRIIAGYRIDPTEEPT